MKTGHFCLRGCTSRLRSVSLLLAVSASLAAPAQGQTAAALPPSMLDQAASPASIDMAGGTLTIHATNSSLRAILNDLQTRTGTKVEGLNRDERIFGVYGPGNPQEVLASLLDDSGYNILISGRKPDGSPRAVQLSARTASAAAQPAPGTRTQAADEDEDSDTVQEAQQPAQFAPPPVPGALTAPGTPPTNGANGAQVKTPQQMLEELQRMRQGSGQSAPQ